MSDNMKEVVFLGDTLRVLKRMPAELRRRLGRTLGLIQTGDTPTSVKPLKGFSVAVQEIRLWHEKDTYRAVYTVALGDRVYLLHVFQKKSKSGIGIPPRDTDLIRQRLRDALQLEKQ